ncbi:hypothetical protein B0H15DRAFT_164436 [Mycena belliarum]|uniref:Uncharacterized protein n=1 Tax=Mycena belliarum TaxID=1033014 RepID=A0AAD6XSU7_9AGAR|nr:hypothetical protein B0H15DRAFT_164436 [Mycena belliae]
MKSNDVLPEGPVRAGALLLTPAALPFSSRADCPPHDPTERECTQENRCGVSCTLAHISNDRIESLYAMLAPKTPFEVRTGALMLAHTRSFQDLRRLKTKPCTKISKQCGVSCTRALILQGRGMCRLRRSRSNRGAAVNWHCRTCRFLVPSHESRPFPGMQ